MWLYLLILFLIVVLILVLFGSGIFIWFIHPTNPPPKKYPRKLIHNKLYEMMYNIDKEFVKHDVHYIAACGTLLGAIRDGGIIRHDFDIDIDCFEYQKELLNTVVEKICKKYGYKLYRNKVGYKIGDSETFDIKSHSGAWVDIYIRYENNDIMEIRDRQYLKKYPKEEKIRKDWIFPIKRCEFNKNKINVPNHPEPILTQLYGDWKTPVVFSPGRLIE